MSLGPFVNRTREQVYSALFRLLQTGLTTEYPSIPVETFTRRFFDLQNFPSASLPALVLVQGEERASRRGRGLVRWEFEAALLYYFNGPSIGGNPPADGVYPVTAVNTFVDAIETILLAMNPDGTLGTPGAAQTLGGLVNDTYISGAVTYDQATFDVPEGTPGVVVVPIVMEMGQLAP